MKAVGQCGDLRSRGTSKLAQAAAVLLACLSVTRAGSAEEPDKRPKVAVGFSNLVARLDNDEIGMAKPEYRVHILETLRKEGFNAVGAESLVFGKDQAERADVVLGGTVTELACKQLYGQLRCSVGIEWQLLDREHDEVVYRVLSRFAALDLPRNNDAAVGRTLTLGALRSLLKRPRFVKLLDAKSAAPAEDSNYTVATFASCSPAARELPRDFEAIAAGTVIVKSGGGTGSGFILSSDGLVLTAAHVVASGKPEVLARDGRKLPARVSRLSMKHDVALLSLGSEAMALPCLPFEPAVQTPGSDVFAVGSPGGEVLGFSLSRGIVSGLRSRDDVELIQTDASISPGNSGGPLIDSQGRVVGIVSRKIAAHAVEGIGFAVPIQNGLTALKLEPAASTTPSLRQAPAQVAPPSTTQAVDDAADAAVSLDPEADRKRAISQDQVRRIEEQKAQTPAYVLPMRYVGFGVGLVGMLGATSTWLALKNDDAVTRGTYEDLRLKNDLFWVGMLAGAGAFTTSFFLVPPLGPSKVARAPRWYVAGGPTNVQLNVSFQ